MPLILCLLSFNASAQPANPFHLVEPGQVFDKTQICASPYDAQIFLLRVEMKISQMQTELDRCTAHNEGLQKVLETEIDIQTPYIADDGSDAWNYLTPIITGLGGIGIGIIIGLIAS